MRFREWSRAAQTDGYPDRIDIRMDNDPIHRVEAGLRGDAGLALEIASVNLAPAIWASTDRLAVDQAAWAPLANTASAELLSRRAGHFTLDANSQPQRSTNSGFGSQGPKARRRADSGTLRRHARELPGRV